MKECGITNISERTTRRILNRHGYGFLTARRKGVLSKKDTSMRLKFAKTMVGKEPNFWTQDIAFYFDGVAFVHKTRPKESASSCQLHVWRKPSEGLQQNCTKKGSKCGNGGKQAKFFVAISHERGVVFAEQYEKLNGKSFAEFITTYFNDIFFRSGKNVKRWLQDGDPSQNSALAKMP